MDMDFNPESKIPISKKAKSYYYRTPSKFDASCAQFTPKENIRKFETPSKSPRREVVRSSAGASVVYPPFLGSFA